MRPWACQGHAPKGVQDCATMLWCKLCKLCNSQLKWQIGIGLEPVGKKKRWQFDTQQVQNPNLPRLAQESKFKATVEAAIATRAVDFFAGLKKAAIGFTLNISLHTCLRLRRCFVMQIGEIWVIPFSEIKGKPRLGPCRTLGDKAFLSHTKSKCEYEFIPKCLLERWTDVIESPNKKHQQWLPGHGAAPACKFVTNKAQRKKIRTHSVKVPTLVTPLVLICAREGLKSLRVGDWNLKHA